jgi:gas vesicle protein
MAEVEYKGLKVAGSQWLIILPLIGTLVGGLWGGFELYNRLLLAEGKLAKINPTQILNQVEMFKESSELELKNLQDLTTVIKDDLAHTASTQRQIRNDVYEMEREMQNRFREMDADIRNNKKDLEEKIETILENPLNDVE